jgi:metal-responsive CopG/Arc/MetJ family transcriptional regulator
VTKRVVRLGISLEPELRESLDRWVRSRNSMSRSEAVRFLVRKELAEKGLADPDADAVGSVTLLYRHDDPNAGASTSDRRRTSTCTAARASSR